MIDSRVAGALLAMLLLWAAGCGRRGAVHVEVSELPPNIREDYAVFVDNCGKCHSLARPLNAPIRDVHHWDMYVAKMMRTPGSGISERETPAILRFLYHYTRNRLAAQRDEGVFEESSNMEQEPLPLEGEPLPPAAEPFPMEDEAAPGDDGALLPEGSEQQEVSP